LQLFLIAFFLKFYLEENFSYRNTKKIGAEKSSILAGGKLGTPNLTVVNMQLFVGKRQLFAFPTFVK